MATQEKQVFYVTDPSNTRWSIVLQGKHLPDNTDENQDFNYETPCLATHVCQASEKMIQMMCMLFVVIIKRGYGKTYK